MCEPLDPSSHVLLLGLLVGTLPALVTAFLVHVHDPRPARELPFVPLKIAIPALALGVLPLLVLFNASGIAIGTAALGVAAGVLSLINLAGRARRPKTTTP